MRTLSSGKLSRALALRAMLLCLCLIFSYLEMQIPMPIPLPGCKPGFANIVITICALGMGLGDALLLSLLRVCLSTLLFGNLSGMWFSFAGALSAFLLLAVLQKPYRRGMIGMLGYSAACAAAHNLGQLAAACLLLGSVSVFSYLPVLMLVALGSGCVSGVILHYVYPALRKTGIFPENPKEDAR